MPKDKKEKEEKESGAERLARMMKQAIKGGNPPPLPGFKIEEIKVVKNKKSPPKNKKG
jgi:hypothetical protein